MLVICVRMEGSACVLMAEMSRIILALLSVVLLALTAFFPVTECSEEQEAAARKEDVPYIKCQVCEKLASQLYQQVKKKQEQNSPNKLSEYQIIEIAENVCNLNKEEADWIRKIDTDEQGDKLELVEQDEEGYCNSECKTIEKACQEVIGYSDTDVAEYIYKMKPDFDAMVKYLCKDLTDSCNKKPPPVPKDRAPGEPFVPKPAQKAYMDKMMRSMGGMSGIPPGMKVVSEEDLERYKKKRNSFGKEAEAEDEDDDENFPNNSRKKSRETDSEKEDWEKKITNEIKNTDEL